MKQKKDLALRKVCNRYMIVDGDTGDSKLSNVYTLNASAALVWDSLAGKDFNAYDVAAFLSDNFDVTTETAAKDAEALCADWLEKGLIS